MNQPPQQQEQTMKSQAASDQDAIANVVVGGDSSAPKSTEGTGGAAVVLKKEPDAVKLFIGQIPRHLEESDIRHLFTPYGQIFELKILRDRATNAHRGCAFLTYTAKKAAEACIQALHEKHTIPGHSLPLNVKLAEGEKDKMEAKVFVGGIPKSMDDVQLRRTFQRFGEIIGADVLKDRATGNSKECGFVKFTSKEAGQAAINEMHDQILEGSSRKLVVRFADSDKKKPMNNNPMANMMGMGMNPAMMNMMMQMYPGMMGMGGMGGMGGAMGGGMGGAMGGAGGPSAGPGAGGQQSGGGMNPMMGGGPGGPMGGGAMGGGPGPMGGGPMGGGPMGMMMGMMNKGMGMRSAGGQQGPPGANLFVHNFPREFTDMDLITLFQPFGPVLSAKVFIDKNTGQSKCFGFVSFEDPQVAQTAIQMMNGYVIQGRPIKVEVKQASQQRNMPY